MDDTLRSAVLGTAGLTLAGVAAVVLTVFRRPIAARRDQLSTVFALLVVLQAMHVVEEYALVPRAGGMANGIAHPLLALQAGAYFPGLVTSPLVGLGGIVLWKRLVAATDGTYTIRRGGP